MIHVEGDWYIDVDNNCFTLGKRYESTDKKGNPTYVLRNCTYHSDLKKAVYAYFEVKEKEVLIGRDIEITDALKIVAMTYSKLSEMLEKVFKK